MALSHNGRELELMLRGEKSLASFCRYSAEFFDETAGQDFSPHVQSGRLRRGKFFVKNPRGENIIYTVFYYPNDEWKFLLYRELKKSVISGWSKEKELVESILLGYDLSSVSEYIKKLPSSK